METGGRGGLSLRGYGVKETDGHILAGIPTGGHTTRAGMPTNRHTAGWAYRRTDRQPHRIAGGGT